MAESEFTNTTRKSIFAPGNSVLDDLQVARPTWHATEARSPSPSPRTEPLPATMLDRVSQGIVVMDSEGRVLSCNDRFASLLGFPAFVVRGSTLDDYFSPKQSAAFRWLSMGDRADERSGDFMLRHFDGSVVPVRVLFVPLPMAATGARHVGAVFTDQRDEYRSNARIVELDQQLTNEVRRRKASAHRFVHVLELADAATWEYDVGTGRVAHSVGMARLFGAPIAAARSVEAIIGAFVPSDREAIASAFGRAAIDGAIDVEGRIDLSTPSARWLRLKGRMVATSASTLAGVATDVTAAHESSDLLRRASEMEAVAHMAAGIAHDLNNFLQVIGNCLELLGRRTVGDAPSAQLNGAAQHALLRAARLSRQMLTLSRGQDPQPVALSLQDRVPSIRNLLERALPESVRLHIEPPTRLWPCTTDVDQLDAALLNLSINARDAMPDGGVLTVTIENRRIDAGCAITWGVLEGDYVMVGVRDTGTGMPPAVAARVFEPFFTTKAAGKGTGLGLSQVYAFAKRCGGFVNIETSPGRGTAVLLFLPRSE